MSKRTKCVLLQNCLFLMLRKIKYKFIIKLWTYVVVLFVFDILKIIIFISFKPRIDMTSLLFIFLSSINS